jgi:hypothetical protein
VAKKGNRNMVLGEQTPEKKEGERETSGSRSIRKKSKETMQI